MYQAKKRRFIFRKLTPVFEHNTIGIIRTRFNRNHILLLCSYHTNVLIAWYEKGFEMVMLHLWKVTYWYYRHDISKYISTTRSKIWYICRNEDNKKHENISRHDDFKREITYFYFQKSIVMLVRNMPHVKLKFAFQRAAVRKAHLLGGITKRRCNMSLASGVQNWLFMPVIKRKTAISWSATF